MPTELLPPSPRQITGRDHPETSLAAAERVQRTITKTMYAVLVAHREMGALTEAEVRDWLIGKVGYNPGNIDNVRKRRGEMMNPERGYVEATLIERADPEVYGYGPNLDGTNGTAASRYILTPAGQDFAKQIVFDLDKERFRLR